MNLKFITAGIIALLVGGGATAAGSEDLLGSVSLKGVQKGAAVTSNGIKETATAENDAAALVQPKVISAPATASKPAAVPASAAAPTSVQSSTSTTVKPEEKKTEAKSVAVEKKSIVANVAADKSVRQVKPEADQASLVTAKAQVQAQAPVRASSAVAPAAPPPPAPVAKPAQPVVAAAAVAAVATAAPAKPAVAAAPVAQPAPPPLIPQPEQEIPQQKRAPKVRLTDRELIYQQQEAELVRQKRLLTLQSEIAELQKKIDGATAAPVAAPAPPPIPISLAAVEPAEPELVVVMTWTDDLVRKADVLVGGNPVSMSMGDTLPSGWRIVEIKRSSVTFQRGRQKKMVTVRN